MYRISLFSHRVAITQLLSSITPNKPEQGVNHLAPLFLVSHNNADGTVGGGAAGDGGGGATQGQNMQNVSLAQAMGNVVRRAKILLGGGGISTRQNYIE